MKIFVACIALAVLLSGCGLRRHKYDNPITKDTQQPDKVLFDTAIDDIEHSRFERARLTLQTLMNTYDTSEYLLSPRFQSHIGPGRCMKRTYSLRKPLFPQRFIGAAE